VLIDNFAKLNRSSRSAVSAALIVIAAIATYNRIVGPHVTCLLAAQRYESVLGSIMRKNKVINKVVESKRKELQQLREQSAQLQNILFTPNEAKEFLSDLEAIAEETDCAVYSLNFVTSEPVLIGGESENALSVITDSAKLSVVGTYGNVLRLTERLQARTQKVWIGPVRIEALGDNPDQLKCDMTIAIYTIKDKEATLYE